LLTNREIVDLVDFRHALHRTPELSGQERETAARVADRLRGIGADRIVTGLGGFGVAGVFEGRAPGPTVMLRAELDALPIEEIADRPHASAIPGRGHMCGHDGHAAALMGCAHAFARRRPARGRVVLLFQPAEEDGSGAAAVIADPRFAELRPDMAFAWHNMPGLPLGHARFRAGPMFCASVGLHVRLEGRTAHASQPETGLSPAQTLAALIRDIVVLGPGGPMDEEFALVTVTHARLGEPSYGVAPGRADLQATLRALTPGRMARLRAEAEALALDRAQAAGLSVAVDWHDDFACTANDAEATEVIRRVLDTRGVPWEGMSEPYRFSEDFGRFGAAARTAMIILGAGTAVAALHNPDYDFPDDLIPVGAGILTDAARAILG
jgi:amidohydrolase